MADEISKKVLIEVELANQDAQSGMQGLKTDVDALAQSVTALKAATQSMGTAVNSYNEKIAQSKLNIQLDREETAKLSEEKKRAAIAIKGAKDATVAATGSYAEAAKKLSDLGKAIKNTEGGFNSQDKAIKAQIKNYNDLNNKLKAFDAQMGNHQRNVGNYTGALEGINGVLGRLIPGFSQFATILQGASQGFNAMKGSASGATDTVTEAETAMVGWGGTLAVVAAGLASVIYYMSEFRDSGDKLTEFFGGVKEQFANFGKNIVDMFNKKDINARHLFKGFQDSFNEGIDISKLEIQAKHEDEISQTLVKQKQVQADEFRAMAKNRSLDIADREKYLHQAQYIENEIVDNQKDNADLQIKLALDVAEKHKKLLPTTRRRLEQGEGDIETANYLANNGDITQKGYEMYKAALDKRADALGTANMKLIRQQNDAANILDKINTSEIASLARIKQATETIESERLTSITKTLNFQREAFAKELSDSDEHYRQLIFKQRKFIEDMQVIIDNKKSTAKEKTAARSGISAANSLIGQLNAEQTANQQKLLEEHAKVILAETQKAANELTALQISGIKDVQERERQAENLAYKEKTEANDKELTLLKQNQIRLINEIKTATAERRVVLEQELADNQKLINATDDKQIEAQQQHDKKLLEIKRNAAQQQLKTTDEISIIKSSGFGENPDRKANLEAQKQELADDDKFNKIKADNQEITFTEYVKLHEEYLAKIKELDSIYLREKQAFELQTVKQISDAGLNILQQSIQRANEAADKNREREKTHELQNQSLTSTQKYEVEEKYRVLDGKAKVKAFRQQQELDIAKAVISGALALVAAEEQPYIAPFVIPGIIVTTALSIAEIAAQKPPAYAQGGIHYNSDGKGGVLPGYSKTDNTNAHLRSGEGVVVSEAMRDPWARNLVSAINQSYGGRSFDNTVPIGSGFASGGVFSTYLPTGDNGLRPSNVSVTNRLHPDDIYGIGQAVANIRFPAIAVDVKDINNQQQLLATPYDRGTH